MVQLALLLNRLFDLYAILLIVWVALSWFLGSQNEVVHDAYAVLSRIVEPYVGLFRRWARPMGGVDWSPFVALIVLRIIQRLVVNLFF